MRALNFFSMITMAFFLVLALFLKPVVMEMVDMFSEPVERRCTEDEVVRMNMDELKKEVVGSMETDSSWVGESVLK